MRCTIEIVFHCSYINLLEHFTMKILIAQCWFITFHPLNIWVWVEYFIIGVWIYTERFVFLRLGYQLIYNYKKYSVHLGNFFNDLFFNIFKPTRTAVDKGLSKFSCSWSQSFAYNTHLSRGDVWGRFWE